MDHSLTVKKQSKSKKPTWKGLVVFACSANEEEVNRRPDPGAPVLGFLEPNTSMSDQQFLSLLTNATDKKSKRAKKPDPGSG